MTPSGSVAGHLTDLVSGEVSWARACPGLSPARQSRPSGREREERDSRERERLLTICRPGSTTLQPEVAVVGPVNLRGTPPFTVTASRAHPSSFPPPPPPGEMDNAILGKTTKDWLSILTIGDSSLEKLQTKIGFDAVTPHSVPCIESPSKRRSQMSGVERLAEINNSGHEIILTIVSVWQWQLSSKTGAQTTQTSEHFILDTTPIIRTVDLC